MHKPYRRHSAVLLLLGALLFISAPVWSAFPTADYFPLPDGASWNYIDSDSFPYSAWVVSGTVNINGVPTKELADSEDNSFYYTNDANGLRLHRLGIPFASSTVTFKPPIRMVNAAANIGDRLQSSGTADLLVPGAGTFEINYTATSTIAAAERITVPAGTFDTIRHTLTFRLFGTINNVPLDETSTGTLWIASGVGIVKDDEAEFGILRLIDTNVASKLPAVSINFPAESAILTQNFDVKFTFSNWAITGGSHFHWFLDGVDQGPRYDLSPIPVSGLADGPHTIVLRLANADHSFTGTESSVSFIFEKQSGTAAITTIINTILLSE